MESDSSGSESSTQHISKATRSKLKQSNITHQTVKDILKERKDKNFGYFNSSDEGECQSDSDDNDIIEDFSSFITES